MDPFYAVVRVMARFWMWFFFERIEVRHPERVPRTGPVLLCINHPNNLIDSLRVGSLLPRQVQYLATGRLFRNPVVARALLALGAIPVHRRADDRSRGQRNLEMVAACAAAFDRGRLVAIYPEGATRAEPHLQQIKTGAARIALGYEAHAPGRLAVVPVGLSSRLASGFAGVSWSRSASRWTSRRPSPAPVKTRRRPCIRSPRRSRARWSGRWSMRRSSTPGHSDARWTRSIAVSSSASCTVQP